MAPCAGQTDNVPLNGEAVLMTLGSGTSAQSCTGTTNPAGTASCTIPSVSQSLGSILVVAKFAGDDYYKMVSGGSMVNVPAGTQLTVNSTPPAGIYNTPSTVSATLVNTSNNNAPVPNEPVTFEVNNDTTQMCTAMTNNSGVASCPITPNEPAGNYSLNVTFPGDSGSMPQLLPNATSSTFTVTQAQTTLSYTGTTSVTNGQPAILSGVLTQTSSGTDVLGQTVTFTLGSGSSLQSCTTTTNTSGAASCTIASVNQQSSGSVGVSASSSTGQDYSSSTAASTATVHSPTTLTVLPGQTDFADATIVSRDAHHHRLAQAHRQRAGDLHAVRQHRALPRGDDQYERSGVVLDHAEREGGGLHADRIVRR